MVDTGGAAFTSRKVATIVRDLDFELDLEGASFPLFCPRPSPRRSDIVQRGSCARVRRKPAGESRSARRPPSRPARSRRGARGPGAGGRRHQVGRQVGVAFVDPSRSRRPAARAAACVATAAPCSKVKGRPVCAPRGEGSFAALVREGGAAPH